MYLSHPIFPSIFSDLLNLFVGGCIFFIVYVLCVPLLRAINRDDVESLREISKGLGPLSQLIKLLLGLMEKMMNL